ncbi:MAG TPA: Lrp/AsnC family transcriptional regulator [Holophaga sp.]|nr:Lrp/AsnC family transcriptional regulator [Holophaga sp.]HPS66482.1 Lrp/AsnC family transcriptional regulator [Holophaga sp.]
MAGTKLDPINLRILEALQCHGRITNQELAEQVALSPSACLARVRKLEADGIIPRYLADLALDKIGHILEAFIEVTLENHSSPEVARFLKLVEEHPHMVSCHRVSGHYDYLLYVVAQDMPQLRQVADALLEDGLGVAKIATIPILDRIKAFPGYPLRRLF